MPKYDPDMPSGEISPPLHNATKWQNGHAFDDDGNCIDLATGKIIEAAEPETEDPSDDEGDQQQTSGVAASSDVDVQAWARGELKGVPWFTVKKVLEDQGYPITAATTAAEAREMVLAKA